MQSNKAGFTILELMIAISVFTIAIMLVTSGVIQIGKDYRNGAIRAKINTFSRELHASFTQEIQYSGMDPVKLPATIPPAAPNSINTAGYDLAICMGKTRYLLNNGTGQLGVDKISGSSACNDPVNLGLVKNPLPKDSRYTRFDVTIPLGTGLYILSTRFVIGPQDMFVGDDFNNSCKSGRLLGGEFCAVIELNSEMARKVYGS